MQGWADKPEFVKVCKRGTPCATNESDYEKVYTAIYIMERCVYSELRIMSIPTIIEYINRESRQSCTCVIFELLV